MSRGPTQHQATTDTAVQEFWLQNLSKADAFTRWVVREISPWLGQRVLEVGCGIGTYTAEMAVGARTIIAMDMERTFVEEAARRLGQLPNVQLICGDATTADLPNPDHETLDTVVLLDVLEHIEDDVALLTRLGARLGQRGHLILKECRPCRRSIRRWMRRSAIGVDMTGRLDAGHLSAPTSRWFGSGPSTRPRCRGGGGDGRVRKLRSPRRDRWLCTSRLVPMLRPLDRLTRLFCGVSLIAAARRPAGQA